MPGCPSAKRCHQNGTPWLGMQQGSSFRVNQDPHKLFMSIGQKLRELRGAFNLTQKQFVQRIKPKIDHTYIGKIERGEQNPSLKVLNKIADSMNIKLEYFFTDKSLRFYLSPEKKGNKKIKQILNLLHTFDKDKINFILNVTKFIDKY